MTKEQIIRMAKQDFLDSYEVGFAKYIESID